MQRHEKVRLVCAILVAGLVTAILYNYVFLGAILERGYPTNTFLFKSDVIFSDFYDIFRPVQQGSPLGSKLAVYFPFSYLTLYPLTWMEATWALQAVLVFFLSVLFTFFWHKLDFLRGLPRFVASFILAFSSYAFLFLVTRANLEMFTISFMICFLFLFERGKYMGAGALLACATAMKLYPGVFGVLLLKRRQYKASVVTAVMTLLLTIGAASLFPGGLLGSIDLLSANLDSFKTRYVLDGQAIPFSSSYFSVLKIAFALAGANISESAQAALLPYTVASAVLFALVTIYILVWEKVLWRQVCLLSILAINLPTVSFDYKLIYMLLPLALFVSEPGENREKDRFYSLLFGLILIPKAYVASGEVTIGVVLNPLLMTLMMAHIVWSGLRASMKTTGEMLSSE